MTESPTLPRETLTDDANDAQLSLSSAGLTTSMPDEELAALLEALLLVAQEPPTIDELAAGAEVATEDVERALTLLEQQPERGWVIQRHGRRIHIATAPRFADKVRVFLGLDREARLSSASLEALAIVA